MKKPEIVYCNVIRKDDKQGEVAIKARDIEGMIDASIDLINALEVEELSPDSWNYYFRLKQAIKKAGTEL